ncbi:META domain-containing protein [Salinicola endophyticus]|uniref:META domain-containing protein n=1 Tax=Salinicola endophyticus TaxID=1949083 RepID=A0ABY8FDE9_9GAMM|nr:MULTISPECIES: META domain-containing protein [Salinicola]WFF40687.1 META domain-containing protein [Salinicola endophyticus]
MFTLPNSLRLALLGLALASLLGGCAGHTAPASSESLVDTYWRLESLGGESAVVDDQQREAHLVFNAAGHVRGSTGCNRLMGRYQHTGDALSFSALGTTRRACPGALQGQEQDWLDVLSRTRHLSRRGDRLVLEDSRERALATLRATALY